MAPQSADQGILLLVGIAAHRCYHWAVASLSPMSDEQIREFIARVRVDSSLQEKLKAATDAAAVVAIAKAAGFVLCVDDLNEFQSEFDELELEGAAGGWYANWRSEQDDEYVGRLRGCQEEAHDEIWGRCPGMRPMRKWLFGKIK